MTIRIVYCRSIAPVHSVNLVTPRASTATERGGGGRGGGVPPTHWKITQYLTTPLSDGQEMREMAVLKLNK